MKVYSIFAYYSISCLKFSIIKDLFSETAITSNIISLEKKYFNTEGVECHKFVFRLYIFSVMKMLFFPHLFLVSLLTGDC